MLRHALIGLTLSLFFVAQACSTPPPVVRVCTRGSNAVCKCVNGQDGTKECNETEDGFGVCRLDINRPCDSDSDSAPPPEEESCPGRTISITKDPQVISGSTAAATDDLSGGGACAAGTNAPDHVYTLIATETGKLDIELVPDAGFDAMMYVGPGECGKRAAMDYRCVNAATTAGTREVATIGVIKGEKYNLVVDGAAGNASRGDYSLTLKLTTGAFCGDGQVSAGEACDDSNDMNNDGCAAGCKNVDGNPPAGDACPGQPVHLWKTAVGGATALARVSGTGSTDPAKYAMATNKWKRHGNACQITAEDINVSNDRIYAVTSHDAGMITVSVQAQFTNVMLVVRTTCDDPETLAFCRNENGTSTVPANEVLTFPAIKDKVYYVAVDGAGGRLQGDYSVTFEIK
jgi:cysteine-rich repeat protein